MSRKRFNEGAVIETLAYQGVYVTCFRCHRPFYEVVGASAPLRVRSPEREHLHEIALGGPDTPANCRYSCSGCHKIITNGTKATSAGSSKHRIAKTRRLRGELKPRLKKKWAAGRKIAPRPFPKRKP